VDAENRSSVVAVESTTVKSAHLGSGLRCPRTTAFPKQERSRRDKETTQFQPLLQYDLGSCSRHQDLKCHVLLHVEHA
jgi:hypothetical protein